jgi:hypothetical protein
LADLVQVALDGGDDVWGWLVADFGAALAVLGLGTVGGVGGLRVFGGFGGGFALGGFARGVIEPVEEEDGAVHGAGDARVGAGDGVGVGVGAGPGVLDEAVGEFDAFAEEVLAQGADLRRVIERPRWGCWRCRRWGWLVKHERIMNEGRIFVKGFVTRGRLCGGGC